MKQVNGIMGVSGYVMDGFPGVGKPKPLHRARRCGVNKLPIRGDVNKFLVQAIHTWTQKYGHTTGMFKLDRNGTIRITPDHEDMHAKMRAASRGDAHLSYEIFCRWPHKKLTLDGTLSDYAPVRRHGTADVAQQGPQHAHKSWGSRKTKNAIDRYRENTPLKEEPDA